MNNEELKAWIFDIQRYSINDGPGIRTTVFFKGCPLKCLWCDNPESQSQKSQLFHFETLCSKCQRCISICPNEAVSADPDGSIVTNRDLCNACGTCTVICPNDARIITGRLMTVDEVLDIVKQDAPFYRNSEGGMTASGGEATAQSEFLISLFEKAQKSGIHTALDTTGHVKWSVLKKILKYTDLVLLDIKHMNSRNHKNITGISNSLILANAPKIIQFGKPVWVRFPLIPGYNDSDENIIATGEFVLSLGLNQIDILPYHKLGTGKYERLGLAYPLPDIMSYSEEKLAAIKSRLENAGLEVRVA